jgi:glycosyltransferase involved in cell wall biosynthesis
MSAELAVVVPARDEEENVEPLLEEIAHALGAAGIAFEVLIVDDGSHDATRARLEEAARSRAWLRVLSHVEPRGLSAALFTGIAASSAPYVATLDADLQNDPADLPPMLERARRGEAGLVQGFRAGRRDGLHRRLESAVGRAARRLILGDATRDTGCTTRVMTASLARRLPLELAGMHRFIPAYARMAGFTVVEVPVNHRPRRAGVSKVRPFARGLAGLADCLALRWMKSRLKG